MTTSGTFALPTSADRVALLDTSAAIAFMMPDMHGHAATMAALRTLRRGLAGHAATETYSVLTRLPPPARLTPSAALTGIEHNFPETIALSSEGSRSALSRLRSAGIAGGAVYDGLVALAAQEAGLPLFTRDRRAMTTYAALGAELIVIA